MHLERHETQLQLLFSVTEHLTFRYSSEEHLNKLFPDRWIGRGGPHNWSLRSPDPTPLDLHEKYDI
jgi:hypothetical protein